MARNLQLGSTGNDVLELETKLDENGYYVGTLDETFDVHTDAAVRYYQSVNGLTVDGIVGPQTRSSLGLEGGGPPGGGGDGYGIRITAMAADKDGATYTAQAYGPRGGAGTDTVVWANADSSVVESVDLPFEIGPTGSYDRQASTPAAVRTWWEAEAGHDFFVSVLTNVGENVGGSDFRSTQVLGWSGGV